MELNGLFCDSDGCLLAQLTIAPTDKPKLYDIDGLNWLLHNTARTEQDKQLLSSVITQFSTFQQG